MNDDTRKQNTRFLPHFSSNGILDRLRGLDEAGQRRVPMGRETLRAAQQNSLGIGRKHSDDDRGVCTREGQVRQGSPGVASGALWRFPLCGKRSIRRWTGTLSA